MKLVMGFVENQRVGNKFFKVGRKNPIVGKKIQIVGNTTAFMSPEKAYFKEIEGNGKPCSTLVLDRPHKKFTTQSPPL